MLDVTLFSFELLEGKAVTNFRLFCGVDVEIQFGDWMNVVESVSDENELLVAKDEIPDEDDGEEMFNVVNGL